MHIAEVVKYSHSCSYLVGSIRRTIKWTDFIANMTNSTICLSVGSMLLLSFYIFIFRYGHEKLRRQLNELPSVYVGIPLSFQFIQYTVLFIFRKKKITLKHIQLQQTHTHTLNTIEPASRQPVSRITPSAFRLIRFLCRPFNILPHVPISLKMKN